MNTVIKGTKTVEEFKKLRSLMEQRATECYQNHKQVKKLEKKGILKVVGNYEFRTYGRVLKAPLYDAYQFAMIADETVKEI